MGVQQVSYIMWSCSTKHAHIHTAKHAHKHTAKHAHTHTAKHAHTHTTTTAHPLTFPTPHTHLVNARMIASAAGALAGAAGAAYAALQLKTMREGAAAVQLYNLIVSKGDPRLLTRDDVAGLEAQFGIVLGTQLADEVKPIYGAFVEAIIPTGDDPLRYE